MFVVVGTSVAVNNNSEIYTGTETVSQELVSEAKLTVSALDTEITCRMIEQPGKNYNVYILGNDSSADYLIEQLTLNSSSTSELRTQSEKKDLVIISDGWVKDNVAIAPAIVNGLVDDGSIVTLYKTSINWDQTDLSISYSDTATMTSVCMIGENTKCYGVQCNSDQEAIQRTITWTDYVTSIDQISASDTIEDDNMEARMNYLYDYQNSGYVYEAIL